MAHLALRYPAATILGVELDRDNAALARLNTQPWAPRCRVLEGAVWPRDGEVRYAVTDSNEDGYSVSSGDPSHTPAKNLRVATAYSVETILNEYFSEQVIDFVKMDIEGAEKNVLKENTAWIDRVRCIKIELHGYDKRECIADLNSLGLTAWPDASHPDAVVATSLR